MSQKNETNIIRTKEFNIKDFQVQKIYTNKKGAKSVSIFAKNPLSKNSKPSRFHLQTPYMYIPFGLTDPATFGGSDKKEDSEKQSEGTSDYKKYSLNFDFRGFREKSEKEGEPGEFKKDSKVYQFYEQLKQLDDQILEWACENAEEWLPTLVVDKETGNVEEDPKMIRKLVTTAYKPIIKKAKKKVKDKNGKEKTKPTDEYAPSIRAKIAYSGGKFQCSTYLGKSKEPIEESLLEQDIAKSNGQAILRCDGIWLMENTFGCTFSLVKLRLKAKASYGIKDEDYAFRPESDDEDDEDQQEGDESTSKSTGVDVEMVDSDGPVDDDEDDDDDDEIVAEEDGEDDDDEEEEEVAEEESDEEPEPVKPSKPSRKSTRAKKSTK